MLSAQFDNIFKNAAKKDISCTSYHSEFVFQRQMCVRNSPRKKKIHHQGILQFCRHGSYDTPFFFLLVYSVNHFINWIDNCISQIIMMFNYLSKYELSSTWQRHFQNKFQPEILLSMKPYNKCHQQISWNLQPKTETKFKVLIQYIIVILCNIFW